MQYSHGFWWTWVLNSVPTQRAEEPQTLHYCVTQKNSVSSYLFSQKWQFSFDSYILKLQIKKCILIQEFKDSQYGGAWVH